MSENEWASRWTDADLVGMYRSAYLNGFYDCLEGERSDPVIDMESATQIADENQHERVSALARAKMGIE